MNPIVYSDMLLIISQLGDLVNRFENKKILITGYKGFLGANYTSLFYVLNREVFKKKAKIYCMDSNIVDLDDQISDLAKDFTLIKGSSIEDLPIRDFNYIIHCAGIASPTYYRKYPLETIKVNAIGYWDMLNNIDYKSLEGFLYFSTSEVYGDPDVNNIPTNEDYRGNVSCIGPRACYDESKRLGETISVSFYNEKGLPVKIVRPFNVYGPYMRLNDKRVIPDFVKFAFEEGEIKIFSDGSPTRAFCYITDALNGFTRVLLLGKPAIPYNIGNDTEEISMNNLAQIISDITGSIKIEKKISKDKEYLTDNPQRRCPDITRARKELGFIPSVSSRKGLERVINWYRDVYFLK